MTVSIDHHAARIAESAVMGGARVLMDAGVITGTDGDDVLDGSSGPDTISGLGGADLITGDAGDDSLSGGAGNDVIVGGPGADTLAGGGGANIFEYTTPIDSPAGFALAGGLGRIDHIVDWTSQDFLQFFGDLVATPANYAETTAPDFQTAYQAANANLSVGVRYTVAQVGADVVVFALGEGHAIDLVGANLNEISISNLGPGPSSAAPSPGAVSGATGQVIGDMDSASLTDVIGGAVTTKVVSAYAVTSGAASLNLTGGGFTYDATFHLTGGQISHVALNDPAAQQAVQVTLDFPTTLPADAGAFGSALQSGVAANAFSSLLAGSDTLSGGATSDDLIHGYDGNDVLYGFGGHDSLFGGNGDDTIYASAPAGVSGAGVSDHTYLRGEDGDDSIQGGSGFDDINGNKGNDTIDGGSGGSDWLVGGQGDDSITAHHSSNILYGNLGNDTLHGGDGGDVIRGGQGDDVIVGGSGNDYISGDRGNDTETGGAGADTFHGSQDAGVDKVLDFNQAEGDRVMLDPGTTYTVSQVGADTVIDMGNGNQMILVGVQFSSLKDGWIFEG